MQSVLAILERLQCKFDTGEFFFFNDSNEFIHRCHTSLHFKGTMLTYRIFLDLIMLCISFLVLCVSFFFILQKMIPPYKFYSFTLVWVKNEHKLFSKKNVVYNFLFFLLFNFDWEVLTTFKIIYMLEENEKVFFSS